MNGSVGGGNSAIADMLDGIVVTLLLDDSARLIAALEESFRDRKERRQMLAGLAEPNGVLAAQADGVPKEESVSTRALKDLHGDDPVCPCSM